MVLGLLTITSIPTVIGVCEAVSAQKKQNAAAKERVKFNLSASVPFEGPEQDAYCVLAHGKVYLDHPEAAMPGYRFNGYYFNYPSEEQHRGLVSTISDDPPMLNWVFIDRDTGQLRYGGRHDTLGHLVGPWGWSEDEENLTFQGRDDVFLVVEEEVEEDDGLFTQLAVYAHPGLVGAGGLAALEEKAVHRVRLRRRTGIESKYVRDSEA